MTGAISIQTEPYEQYIGGEWTPGHSGKVRNVLDPATNKPFASIHEATSEDIDHSVEVAKKAFEESEWKKNPRLRMKILLKFSDLIKEQSEYFATLESLETGHPLREMNVGVAGTIANFEYFAGLTDKAEGEYIPVSGERFAYTIREPLGVLGQVVPWNAPLTLMARGVAPALAFGNTVVIKPSVVAPLTNLELGKLVKQAGFPDGVVNVVCGPGEVCGEALALNKDVDKIIFTGSVEAGKRVMELATRNLTPVLLELGGKAPFIVTEGVAMEEAVDGVMSAALSGQGEICFSGTRFFIPSSMYDTFSKKLSDKTSKVKIGPGLKEGTEMGPLITKKHLERVSQYVDDARSDGARVVTGGSRPDSEELADGNFYLPTLLDNVTNDMQCCQEEIFGPVLSLLEYDDDDEVIRQANQVDFGLSAFVWTNDLRKAHKFAHALQAGSISIFTYGYGPAIPRGGYKLSGLGRECGLHAIDEYTQIKNVNIGLSTFPGKYRG